MPLADIVDYAIKHKIVSFGAVLVILVLIGVLRFAVALVLEWRRERRAQHAPQTEAHAGARSNIQQTAVRDVKADGDVTVSPSQVVSEAAGEHER